MVAQERELQRHEEAQRRYEEARQRLDEELGDRVTSLVRIPNRDLMPLDDTYTHRAAVIEAGLQLITPLRRFIRHELELRADPVLIERDVFEIDDLVAATYIAAVEEADGAPVARAYYTWLRRIARRQIRAAIVEVSDRNRLEASLHTPVAVGRLVDEEDDWPDDVHELIDILADPDAPLPEDILELQALQDTINRVLARLPEQWREVFLMKTVDGWSDEEISTHEGLDPQEITRKVEISREFLRSWLEQARPGDNAA